MISWERTKETATPTTPFLRIGAVCGCVASVIAVLGNVLHGHADDNAHGLHELAANGQFHIYQADHFMLVVALILAVGGLAAIADSIRREPDASWARLGFLIGLMGTAVMVAALGIDGFAMVNVARSWTTAPPADQAALFQAAQVLWSGFVGIFALAVFIYFGCSPLLYAMAFRSGNLYPRWLGIVAGAGGMCGLVLGFLLAFFTIPFWTFGAMFFVTGVLDATWVFTACLLIWRRTHSAGRESQRWA